MRAETRISEIGRPAPRFLERFALEMRESDALEVLGTTGTPRGGLAAHLGREIADAASAGGRTWAVTERGRALALFGVVPDSAAASSARIWMLAAGEAQARPVSFARWSRRCLRRALQEFPEIEVFHNFAPAAAGPGREWLAWLGAWFPARGACVSPWTGERFSMFAIQREDVNV